MDSGLAFELPSAPYYVEFRSTFESELGFEPGMRA